MAHTKKSKKARQKILAKIDCRRRPIRLEMMYSVTPLTMIPMMELKTSTTRATFDQNSSIPFSPCLQNLVDDILGQ